MMCGMCRFTDSLVLAVLKWRNKMELHVELLRISFCDAVVIITRDNGEVWSEKDSWLTFSSICKISDDGGGASGNLEEW